MIHKSKAAVSRTAFIVPTVPVEPITEVAMAAEQTKGQRCLVPHTERGEAISEGAPEKWSKTRQSELVLKIESFHPMPRLGWSDQRRDQTEVEGEAQAFPKG